MRLKNRGCSKGGSSIGNADREKLVEFNALCDDPGLNTISAGGVIADMWIIFIFVSWCLGGENVLP
jgi:aldehyde:ferredoxin oxidoreductase